MQEYKDILPPQTKQLFWTKTANFLAFFCNSLNILKIHYHIILSSDNHNPMMVEWINHYLNKGLHIMTNKRSSVWVAMECILLLLYAWYSCPIPGTDISRSLVAVGSEFNFRINYTTNAHWNLTASMPKTIESYAGQLTACLDLCCKIAQLLIHKHCALHQVLVNSQCPETSIFAVGHIVFARCTVPSDSAKQCVDN